jgi:rhamnulokinase
MRMIQVSCVAVDLGASSGRIAVVGFDGKTLSLREVRRFETPRCRDAATGYQCWDVDGIESEIRAGVRAAAAIAPLASVGVDGWGVDHVLLDAERRPVGPAVSYRDDRTRGMMEAVFAQVPAEEIYRRTGIQFQPFNTLYQLAATARRHPSWLDRARHLVMLPDYFHFRLCGTIANEYTNATTTQLCALDTGDWDHGLLAAAGVDSRIVTAPIAPGTNLGETPARDDEPHLAIVAPGTHDTASAVAALALGEDGDVFLSSGTWSLMGVESAGPLAGDRARLLNVSNEGGVERRYRVLKNIAGLWLLQRIGEELGQEDAAALVAAASAAPAWRSLVDPNDPRFLNPRSMIAAVRAFCVESGQPPPADRGALARCVLDSLALSYRRVKEELEALAGHRVTRIHIGGGGGQNLLLDQLAADACQVPVSVGPAEISVLGNACVQLIGLGHLASLAEARALVRQSFAAREFTPRQPVPEAAWSCFRSLAGPRLQPREDAPS